MFNNFINRQSETGKSNQKLRNKKNISSIQSIKKIRSTTGLNQKTTTPTDKIANEI